MSENKKIIYGDENPQAINESNLPVPGNGITIDTTLVTIDTTIITIDNNS